LQIRGISSLRINLSFCLMSIIWAAQYTVHIYTHTCSCYMTNSSSSSAKNDMDLHTHISCTATCYPINTTDEQQQLTDKKTQPLRSKVKCTAVLNKCHAGPLRAWLRIKSNACNPILIYHHTASFVIIAANDYSTHSKQQSKLM